MGRLTTGWSAISIDLPYSLLANVFEDITQIVVTERGETGNGTLKTRYRAGNRCKKYGSRRSKWRLTFETGVDA